MIVSAVRGSLKIKWHQTPGVLRENFPESDSVNLHDLAFVPMPTKQILKARINY